MSLRDPQKKRVLKIQNVHPDIVKAQLKIYSTFHIQFPPKNGHLKINRVVVNNFSDEEEVT